MSRRIGFEDEDAIMAQAESAVLVVFAVHGVLAGRVLPELHAVDTQVADGEVLVHVEERTVDRSHRAVFLRHLGGLRATRFVREPQRIIRRIGNLQHKDLLVRGEQLLSFEPALLQNQTVERVGLPRTVRKGQGVSLRVEAQGESEG